MPLRTIHTKACSRCGVAKPFSEFYADRSRKDVLHPACKSCCREAQRLSYKRRTEHLRTPEAKAKKALKILQWLEKELL